MKTLSFVALDLETSGKYPLGSEICEVALIRFNSGGEILDQWSSLIQLEKGSMEPLAQSIHGISERDLAGAPRFQEVASQIYDFIGSQPLVAHNLPFDLGFLACEFQNFLEPAWFQKMSEKNFCTSLISLGTHPKLSSHRLKDLSCYFELEETPNHRAFQDAQTCMKVFLKLLESAGGDLEKISEKQKQKLNISSFIPEHKVQERPELQAVVKACEQRTEFELIYSKGSKKNKWRKLEAKGLVLKEREAESFLVATDPGETQTKRFMLSKVKDSRL